MIRGEVVVPVRLCLAALPGQRLDDIERVYSHIQALGQAEALPARSAVAAALDLQHGRRRQGHRRSRRARRGGRPVAAGGRRCSGWRSWPTSIGDLPGNRTRFLVLARPDAPTLPTARDRRRRRRTTLVVAVRNEPGTLLAVLRVFAEPRPQHAQARVATEPRARLGVRLLGRPRRRHRRPGDAPPRSTALGAVTTMAPGARLLPGGAEA